METINKLFSGCAATRARLALFAVTLVAALVGVMTPAWANLSSVGVGAQSGALTSGTAATASFAVTINRTLSSPTSANLSVTTTLPAGATSAFWSAATGGTQLTNPVALTAATTTVYLRVSTLATTPAGSQSVTVQAAQSGATTRTGSNTLLIRGNQTITFGALANKTYTDPDFNVSATASSGLPVSFGASGNCTVAAASVHLLGAGSCTITASQAGNAVYFAAPNVLQTFAIAAGNQTITFNTLPDKFIGDAPFNVSATSTSGLAVSFTAAGDCTIAGSTVTLTATVPGSCTITASQAGNANFNAATAVARTFAINTFTGTELYSVSGTAALPGGAVTVWGYNAVNAPVTQPGGPTLIVNQGDAVAIRLNNQLAETTALLFQGQAMVPDTTGVAPGASKVYVFIASQPGTFLYEAGLLHNAEHQVAMGLHGALVVRPTASATQAYTDVTTTFNDEAVLVLSEIDPVLNNAADPAAFDMRNFAPSYFLINGQAYPNTAPIATVPGNKVLLRYINAGVQHHSMAVLGLRQNFVAKDASLLPTLTRNVAAETLAPGQTADAIATVPATAAVGSLFAVYDGSLKLYNNGDGSTFGGMLTFVTTGTGTPGGDTVGPATSAMSVTATSVSATVSDAGRGDSNVTAAEFFVDTTGANGSGTAMTGTFGTVSVTVSGTISPALTGTRTVYVHGLDAAGNWGPYQSSVLTNDVTGPTSSGLTLTPNPSNGTVAVALHATGNDSATGGANIAAAEYFLGVTGADGTGTAMTVNAAAPVASLDATLAPPVTSGVVYVHSQDAVGNWGPFASITLSVVATGPVTSAVSALPNPTNGAVPLNSSQPVVRVTATMTSTGSTVAGAEGFIDTVGTNGAGFPFVPTDGQWNGASEIGTADIPLGTIAALSDGNHTIYVHGRDAAGNWGATSTTILVVDKIPPTLVSVSPAASTVAFGAGTLTVTATDVGTGVTGGQFWVDGSATPPASPTAFTGTSISLSGLTGGQHTVYVRVRDAAGNWSAVSSATVYVVQAVADSKAFNATTTTGTQTQSYNTNGTSLRANDFPTNGSTALVSAPIRIAGTGTGVMTLTCTSGTAAPTVGGSTICTNGRFTVNLPNPGGTANQRQARRRGTFTFTYSITSGGVTSPPATVTITVN